MPGVLQLVERPACYLQNLEKFVAQKVLHIAKINPW
jgi:hypothetical protein